jgi:hypothetical protein
LIVTILLLFRYSMMTLERRNREAAVDEDGIQGVLFCDRPE